MYECYVRLGANPSSRNGPVSGSELRFACPNGHPCKRSCKLAENCPTCRTQTALSEAVAMVLTLVPTLSTELAAAAVSTVAPSTGERQCLVRWLRDQPADLGSIGSDCPPVAVRLLDNLATQRPPGRTASLC